MTRTDPAHDEVSALANITDPSVIAYRDAARLAHEFVRRLAARGRTARGALVLAFVAPVIFRKPDRSRPCPDGWVEITIERHLLPELVGTWWVPSEISGKTSGTVVVNVSGDAST